MTFIVTLIALLLERFFDWSHLRRWSWYTNYQRMVMQRSKSLGPYVVLALTIVPLMLATGLIQYALQNVLFGFIELLFQLFILIYCLGQQNLWADTFASINALLQGDVGMEKLKTSFGITDTNTGEGMHRQLLTNIFIQANRRVFAIVFWFVILGPIGAVLYRTVALSAHESLKQETSPELVLSARSVQAVIDWIPVRLLTVIFALGGHFVKVLSCWRKKTVMGLDANDNLLVECGLAALGDSEENIAQDGSVEKNAISLLDRAFIITLVIIAILYLVVI